jgi:uncharacterized membrane protein (DUF2068 family)
VRAALAWLRWEMGRRIELEGFLRFIVVERFVKGGVLILGGIALIAFSSATNLVDLTDRLRTELVLDPGRHLWTRFAVDLLDRVDRHVDTVAAGVVLYGLLEVGEGVGLLLRRRWAEYLVLVATTAFLPVEIDEVIRHVTVVKLLALLVNIAIVAYLVWRKRLFLERPGSYTVEAGAA